VAVLIIGDKEYTIPGLGKNRPLADLSQKRITKAAREFLALIYGSANIKVSCSADVALGIWTGQCWINGQRHSFKIENYPISKWQGKR